MESLAWDEGGLIAVVELIGYAYNQKSFSLNNDEVVWRSKAWLPPAGDSRVRDAGGISLWRTLTHLRVSYRLKASR